MLIQGRHEATDPAESRARADAAIGWLRDWAERRVNLRLIDERRCIPPHVALDLGNRGLFGLNVEERYGGLGLRFHDTGRVIEQLAALDLGLASWLLTSLFPGIRPIAAYGSPALREELLPALASGRLLAGFAQTEPGAGSHLGALGTEAHEQPDGTFRLRGEKAWIGNATWAGVLTVIAHEVGPTGRRRGMTAFAVRTDRPGVRPGREFLSMGMRGMVQGAVHFDDAPVDAALVLGTAKRGLEVSVDSMSLSRFAIGAAGLGAMRRCAQLMLRFAGRRSIATGRLVDNRMALARLGAVSSRIAATESLLARVIEPIDEGGGVAPELLAACKVAGSELLWESVDELVQVLGSRGYDEGNAVPQLLRDARVTRIYEGATEPLLAFVGAQALDGKSALYAFLCETLAGGAQAERLQEAVEGLLGRSEASGQLLRNWQCMQAGRGAVWALLGAALAARPGSAPGHERMRAWIDERFARACARARDGGVEEDFDRAEIEATIEAQCEPIGDVEPGLPGAREELDPLLRRSQDAAGASDQNTE